MKKKIAILLYITTITNIVVSMEKNNSLARWQEPDKQQLSENGKYQIHQTTLTGKTFNPQSLGYFLQQRNGHLATFVTTLDCEIEYCQTILNNDFITNQNPQELVIHLVDIENHIKKTLVNKLTSVQEENIQKSIDIRTLQSSLESERQQHRQTQQTKEKLKKKKQELEQKFSKIINKRTSILIGLGVFFGTISVQWIFHWAKARLSR